MRLRAILLTLGLCAFAALVALVPWHKPEPATAAGTNSIETPDSGPVGRHASLELDSNGYPVVSYYDESGGNLKLMHCNDVDCAGSNESIETVDNGTNTGEYTSLELDASGFPVISYYSPDTGDLKVAHCNDVNCAGADPITSPDTTDNVGEYNSLVLDGSGFPVVSYYNATDADLKLLHCGNANCTASNSIELPDTTDNVGTNTSLVLDSSGFPVISYYDQTNLDLKVLHCGDANCSSGNTITAPDTTDNVGAYTSVALDSSGFPLVSYHDGTDMDLKLLHCGDATCSSGNSITSPDTTGDVGYYTFLALDEDGFPVVSYYDNGASNLNVLHCNDEDCAGSDDSIESPDTSGDDVGRYSSLVLDSDGFPVIAYQSDTAADLKVAHCGDKFCAGTKPLTITVDDAADASDDDPGDGVCDDGAGNCTLRAAIEEASALAGGDTIAFDQGTFPPSSPPTLEPAAGYTLTGDGDTIDATDAGVIIDGMGGAFDCFTISGDGNQIVGIEVITDCGNGVVVTGANNTVGGINLPESGGECANATDDDDDGYINDGCPQSGSASETLAECTLGDATNDDPGDDSLVNDGCGARGQGITINGNVSRGVEITGTGATGNQVLNCLLGTNEDGTSAVANGGAGVRLSAGASDNLIGSDSAPVLGNLISGNSTYGVNIVGSTTTGNMIYRNAIGTDLTFESALPNIDDGINITAPDNIIGGAGGLGNVISGNGESGVHINLSTATGNRVEMNVIGTNQAGTAEVGNHHGVWISDGASDNTIGGAGAGNVISGNDLAGVFVDDVTTSGNVIQGNAIGTNVTGTAAIANSDGVTGFFATDTLIGDPQGIAGNLISGNTSHGIALADTTGDIVDGNLIGTDVTGTSAIPNGRGLRAGMGASDSAIGLSVGNTIAFNTLGGLIVGGSGADVSGISVHANSIHSNGGPGIDLGNDGVTENDADDVDTGDNNLQNFPDITSALTGSITIQGDLDSTPSTTLVLDFFASSACDGSGNGEGETYLGSKPVTTDGSGDASFTFFSSQTIAPGTFITATATDSSGNTSEFSDCFTTSAVPAEGLSGTAGSPGDCSEGETAQDCEVDGPRGMHAVLTGGGGAGAAGASTVLYFADTGNDKVKKVEPATGTGIVNTVAGTGSPGYNGEGTATSAELDGPRDVFVTTSGDVYIADTNNCRVRKVTSGVISTVAGTGTCGYNGEGTATSAQLDHPSGVTVDAAGNLYIADTENCRIRKVSAGVISTVAGTGTCGYSGDGVLATVAQLNRPRDVSILLPDDDLVVADTDNHRIRRVGLPSGVITSIAGTGMAGYSGAATVASTAAVNAPEALQGVNYRVVFADTQNSRIRRINTLTDKITTLVGDDGTVSTVLLNQPGGVAVLPSDGTTSESLVWSDAPRHVLETGAVGSSGETTETLQPTTSCSILPGTSSIDWLLPAVLLGAVIARRRLGVLFSQLRTALAPAA